MLLDKNKRKFGKIIGTNLTIKKLKKCFIRGINKITNKDEKTLLSIFAPVGDAVGM